LSWCDVIFEGGSQRCDTMWQRGEGVKKSWKSGT